MIGDCKHFTGIQNETCAAGVRYTDVRDATLPGPFRWPCLVRQIGRGPRPDTCAQHVGMSAEDVAAEERETARIIESVSLGVCPHCGAELVHEDSPGSRVSECPTHGRMMRVCKRAAGR